MAPIRPNSPVEHEATFLESLAIAKLPNRDLCALYQGRIDRLDALEAARITGAFTLPETAERAAARRDALAAHARIEREIATLRAQAVREKQISRRVELNLAIKRLESELAATANAL